MFGMRSRRKSISSRPRRTRTRNSRRDGRPTLRQAFHDANLRAKQRANRRMGRRHGLSSMQAAIAGTADDGMIHLNIGQRMLRWLTALMLLPLCVIATRALLNVGVASGAKQTFWRDLLISEHFLYFGIGCVLMMGWFFTGVLERLFLYFYVLGHELTHAVFVYACTNLRYLLHATSRFSTTYWHGFSQSHPSHSNVPAHRGLQPHICGRVAGELMFLGLQHSRRAQHSSQWPDTQLLAPGPGPPNHTTSSSQHDLHTAN